MLCVAFSRRMCCSRVCRVSTKPRLPSTSRVSPAMRPGILRMKRSAAAKKPNDRAAEVEPVAERLALAHADVHAAARPAGLRIAERQRVGGARRAARRCAWPPRPARPSSSTVPRKLGCCRKTARGVVVDRLGQRGGVGGARRRRAAPPRPPSGSRAAWVAQRGARVRVQPARGHELGPLRSRAWPGSPPRPRRSGPRTPRRSTPAGR